MQLFAFDSEGSVFVFARNNHLKYAIYRAIVKYPNRVRVGIHTGPVIAGSSSNGFDIWGDAVNIASRLESFGSKGCINISKSTFEKVFNNFNFEHPKQINVKGKGLIDNYILKV